MKYLIFNKKVLFDDKNDNVNKVFAFIEDCFNLGESCLVHSVRG